MLMILAIEGMSSRFNRHLLNNLGSAFEKFNYLEIGVHKGSTYVSSATIKTTSMKHGQ